MNAAKIFGLACALMISACGEDTLLGGSMDINPEQPEDVAAVVSIPGGTRFDGNAPRESIGLSSTSISNNNGNLTAIPGGTNIITLELDGDDLINNFYVQIDGASSYFQLYVESKNGVAEIPINIDQIANFTSSQSFCVDIILVDILGEPSNPVQQCFNPLNVGTGEFQVSLTWNAATDIDLLVRDPLGNLVYFADRFSAASGLQLDVDDLDGYGPENIFTDSVIDGDYIVVVDNFSNRVNTSYSVTMNVLGHNHTVMGELLSTDRYLGVATISVNDGRVTFLNEGSILQKNSAK